VLATRYLSNTSFSALDHNSNDAVYSPRIFASGQHINKMNKCIYHLRQAQNSYISKVTIFGPFFGTLSDLNIQA
jgi:hypothetical protein